jgi:large subunit ribosomal protein L35
MPWRLTCFQTTSFPCPLAVRTAHGRGANQGSQMPKLKTKSGAKKRFKVTASGKVKCQASRKRHGMIQRPTKFIRTARGTMVLSDEDAKIVKKNFLPYSR